MITTSYMARFSMKIYIISFAFLPFLQHFFSYNFAWFVPTVEGSWPAPLLLFLQVIAIPNLFFYVFFYITIYLCPWRMYPYLPENGCRCNSLRAFFTFHIHCERTFGNIILSLLDRSEEAVYSIGQQNLRISRPLISFYGNTWRI